MVMMILVVIATKGDTTFEISLIAFAVLGSIVIILTLLLVGLPVALYLEKGGFNELYHFVVPALIPGPTFVLALAAFGHGPAYAVFIQTIACAVIGGCAGYVYWFVVIQNYSKGGA
jgi:hypothetical protein